MRKLAEVLAEVLMEHRAEWDYDVPEGGCAAVGCEWDATELRFDWERHAKAFAEHQADVVLRTLNECARLEAEAANDKATTTKERE